MPLFQVKVSELSLEPVEVIHFQSFKTMTTINVREQASGIDFWKTEAHS